jgi:hypothetical protein
MGLIEWIGAILGGIAINLIASELFAWGPRFSNWLTRWAVRRLPIAMQGRLGEEWADHLDALHPLSRTLAAIGFALAACRIRVSFNRHARGALTVREWLTLKPVVVCVITPSAALAMKRGVGKALDAFASGDHYSAGVDLSPEDMLIRLNLMAKAVTALSHVYKKFYDNKLPRAGQQRQRFGLMIGDETRAVDPNDRCSKTWQTSSGDFALESPNRIICFRFRPWPPSALGSPPSDPAPTPLGLLRHLHRVEARGEK